MKHTPGPWTPDDGAVIDASQCPEDWSGVLNNGGEVVAYCHDDNAHLIAAAPDLLAAGKKVLAAWESGDLAAAVRSLSKAITKAEKGCHDPYPQPPTRHPEDAEQKNAQKRQNHPDLGTGGMGLRNEPTSGR